MAGAESHVRVPVDSTGKKMRTVKETIGADEVHNEGVVVVDPTDTTQVLAVDANGKIGVSSMPTITETNSAAIKTAVEALDNAISGSEMQVDVVAALPTGSNAIGKLAANTGVDIGDVDVTSVVPGAGATNLGKAEDATHSSGDVGIMALAIRDDTLAAFSGAENDYEPLHTDPKGRLHVNPSPNITYDHAVFDASASGNLVAAVSGKVCKLHAIALQAAGTVVVNLTDGDGGGSLMEWTLQAREGAVLPLAAHPAHWLQTAANTVLYVQLSAAQTVTINAIYSDEDAS